MPRRVTKLGLFSFCGVLTGAAVAACGDGRREAASDGGQVADAASHGPSPDAGEPATFFVPPPPPPKGSTRSSGTRPPSVPQDGGFDATRPAPPACTPEGGTDEPDEDFTDTNCDGIDGDVSAAVFVAPSGSDDSDGTLEAPVKTLAHAVELAAKAGKSVYACDSEYAEAVTLDGAAVSLYAGYACDHGWRREKDRATVRPAAGVPLTVKATPGAIVIDRFAFRAPDGKDAGASSVAASVVGAKGVTFTRVLLAAGNATSGESGAPVPDPGWSPQEPAADAVTLENAAYCLATGPGAELQGDANCNQVSAGATSDDRTCPFTGHVRGGNGGDGGNYYLALEPTVGGIGLAGGEEHDGLSITVRGFAGAGAESGFGAIDDGAYVASNRGGNARNGFRGHAGRGGNGGASIAGNGSPFVRFGPGGGGGQGGYPGCGGQGGKGGRGGGASIALIAVDSAVTVESSTLITGRGGDGGDGSDGSPGQPGGPGGRGAVMPHGVAGQDGGHGGDGGPGGSGGPGGGGPSIGIVWIGEAVATSTVTFELGRFGRGGKSLDAMAPEGIGAETYSPGESAAAN